MTTEDHYHPAILAELAALGGAVLLHPQGGYELRALDPTHELEARAFAREHEAELIAAARARDLDPARRPCGGCGQSLGGLLVCACGVAAAL